MATITRPDVRTLLGPGGITREVREAQIKMAELVYQALTERRHAVIEAGTGTGKSLGYAVPSALSGNRTVIATGTIALQEQLVNKDLPWLAEALNPFGIAITFGIAKGRANYMSKRRLYKAVTKARQTTITGEADDAHDELRRLAEADAQGIGDRAHLGFQPSADVWRRVMSDSDDCQGKKCPHFATCHFQAARQSLHHVDIIVANHALVAFDMQIDNPETGQPGGVLLPDYGQLVIDEGHHFRDAIFAAFTASIRTGQSMRLVRAIAEDYGGFDQSRVAHALVSAEDQLLGPITQQMGWDNTLGLPSAPADQVREYVAALGNVANNLPAEDRFNLLQARIERMQDTALALVDPKGKVVWAESTKQGIALNAGPINVSPILQQRLYRYTTVVYTSATLTNAQGDFGFAREELGLPSGIITGQFDSPFDYGRQCLMYLPAHLPTPDRDTPIHDDTLREMWRLIYGTRGRAFLLFASKTSMEHAWTKLAGWLEDKGFPCAKQGDRPLPDLVEWFKKTPGAVLFALASFWEGVSIEGEALSLVVIEKIPFPVPTDPIIQARERLIKDGGGDPFRHLMLPKAILRLKQGVGRLIRTQSDLGIVAIMDPRVQTKAYGRNILRAMPPVTVTKRFPTDQQFARFTV